MRQLSPVTLAAIIGAIVLLLLVAYFASSGNADQDKLSDPNQIASADERCSNRATYDAIKRELFRRAAQLRGREQAAFDRLAAYAVLRMQNPVVSGEDEERGSVDCSGSLALDLPPGVVVVGGRGTLESEVTYTVQRAADGSGDVVLLRGADAIIAQLATLARAGGAQPQIPAPASEEAPAAPAETTAAPPATVAPAPPSRPAPRPPQPAPRPREISEPRSTQTSARPSFNCANARTRGELAVCRDSGLAALDRQMASQFYRARSRASAAQRRQLEATRTRFLRNRDSCASDSCIANAYRERMREISGIMNE